MIRNTVIVVAVSSLVVGCVASQGSKSFIKVVSPGYLGDPAKEEFESCQRFAQQYKNTHNQIISEVAAGKKEFQAAAGPRIALGNRINILLTDISLSQEQRTQLINSQAELRKNISEIKASSEQRERLTVMPFVNAALSDFTSSRTEHVMSVQKDTITRQRAQIKRQAAEIAKLKAALKATAIVTTAVSSSHSKNIGDHQSEQKDDAIRAELPVQQNVVTQPITPEQATKNSPRTSGQTSVDQSEQKGVIVSTELPAQPNMVEPTVSTGQAPQNNATGSWVPSWSWLGYRD